MADADPDKRPQPVTMRDVARAANISQSTVSRILSSTQSKVPISEETGPATVRSG
jgi:DNA-directed RNA polymerase specialized sigma54-like protein